MCTRGSLASKVDFGSVGGKGGSVSSISSVRGLLCVRSLQVDAAILDELRSKLEGLMVDLSDLSRRNDDLMTAKDNDLAVIRDLEIQVKEYKRKYEQAKTELRSVKGAFHLVMILHPL